MVKGSFSAVTRLESALVIVVIILAILAGVGYWQAATVAPAITTSTQTIHHTITQTSTVTQTTTLAPGATATVTQTVTQPPTTLTATVTQTATSTVTTTVTAKEAALPPVIKIGVLMPLSGPLAGPGSGMALAAHVAAKQVNDTGGIAGRPIKLIVEDVAVDPKMASDAVQKLVEIDGVQVVIGPPTSAQVLSIAPYVNARKVVLITPSATSGQITELGDDYIFRTVASDRLQARAVSEYIKFMGFKRVALFVRNDAYGRGLASDIQAYVPDRVVKEGVVFYETGKSDYTTELQQIKASAPDAVFYATFVADGFVAFKQALTLGLDKIPSLAPQEERDISFYKDPLAAEFMVTTKMTGFAPVSLSGTPSYVRFAEAYKKIVGKEAGLYTGQTYDATMLAILAIAKAGVYEGPKIKEALQLVSQTYNGPAGYLAFDKNGDVTEISWEMWRAVKTPQGEYTFEVIGRFDPVQGIILTK
ncbi:MAG: ABC transporter substrate-binding protein [Nitrososphaerales archaeon]